MSIEKRFSKLVDKRFISPLVKQEKPFQTRGKKECTFFIFMAVMIQVSPLEGWMKNASLFACLSGLCVGTVRYLGADLSRIFPKE